MRYVKLCKEARSHREQVGNLIVGPGVEDPAIHQTGRHLESASADDPAGRPATNIGQSGQQLERRGVDMGLADGLQNLLEQCR